MSYTPLKVDIPPSPTIDDIIASAASSLTLAHSTQDSQSSHTPTRQPRTSQNVFARLQSLLPQASSSSLRNVPSALPPQSSPRVVPLPKFLKVKVLTWNMHDSLPKGGLDELLGPLPSLDDDVNGAPTGTMPVFSVDPDHFYHIIVVAGQECPSSSAIPKGISAGFRSRDRSRTKLDDKDDISRRWSHDEDREGLTVPDPVTSASGWSLILEDWLCNGTGLGAVPPSTNSSPRPPSALPAAHLKPAATANPAPTTPSSQPPQRAFSADDAIAEHRLKSTSEARRGPYELLTKERLMGIYMAVFVHRHARPFVKGYSKGTVTAGLIGGRLGNKGGVGISMKIENTSLLFLNAHLAAHDGKVPVRLANFAKIKAELSVDEFLSPNDPREMQEDITDRFDYTFLCGDLNFRLDITRLHADWLISRKGKHSVLCHKYEQALAFDQLRNIMRNGQAFVGFKEAPINFPPTFKYDVLRTLKRSKSRKEKEKAHHALGLSEVEEREIGDRDEEDDSEEGEGDATSVVSSAWPVSIQSKRTVGENGDEDYFQNTPFIPPSPKPPAMAAAHVVQKGVNKAKAKWVALLTPGATSLPMDTSSSKTTSLLSSASKRMSTLTLPSLNGRTAPSSPTLPTAPGTSLPVIKHSKSTPLASTSGLRKTSSSKKPTSTKSGKGADDSTDEDEVEKGVYDSSSKQRVPSWCDRILWKSTIVPELEPDDEIFADNVGRPRHRVSQLLQHALRPLRSRRESSSTVSSLERDTGSASGHQSQTAQSTTSLTEELADLYQSASPFSRFVLHSSPKLTKSQSAELLPSPTNMLEPQLQQPVSPRPPHQAEDDDAPVLKRSTTGIPLMQSNTIQPIVTTSRRSNFSRGRTTSSSSTTAPSTVPTGTTQHATSNPAPTPPALKWGFLRFLSRDSSQASVLPERPSTPDSAVPRVPRRGEVVCLSYRTLDDRGMQKLEGRSDHRPVIGSYAIYI